MKPRLKGAAQTIMAIAALSLSMLTLVAPTIILSLNGNNLLRRRHGPWSGVRQQNSLEQPGNFTNRTSSPAP